MHAHRERARASEAELQRREVAKQMGEKAAQIASTTHLSYDEAMSGLMMAYNGVNMETIPKKMAAEFAALLCFCGFFLGVIVMLLIWHPWT